MAHFGRVGIVLSPRLNNNGCHDWHNAHSRQSLNCKLVQRSRELLNWSRCVSWFIAPADQILQWTWKKKLSRIGSSFRALRKPDPPFTNSYGSSICWRKQPGEEVYRCREICGKSATVFDLLQVSVKPLGYQFKEPARDRIGRAIAESIRRFRRKIQATADGKRRKKLELRLGLNCPLNQRRSISVSQSFSYAPCFQGASLSI